MKVQKNYSLKSKNSFAIAAKTPCYYELNSVKDFELLSAVIKQPFYILGEGSNTLFVEEDTPTIIRPNLKGIEVSRIGPDVLVTVQCGENWHQLVKYCVEQGYYGIENLALIPGSVGAAPIQNIGAYGVELSDVVEKIFWYEFSTNKIVELTAKDCLFSYRESIFKHELLNKGLVISIVLRLSTIWCPKLHYRGLDSCPSDVTAKQVYERVINLRQSKLPDPKEIPNAGSFFKNPLVSQSVFQQLKKRYSDIPSYPQPNGKIKLAAGWLIEQCGLKGHKTGSVGVHNKQALVLVNQNRGTGSDIVKLALHVISSVNSKFAINIVPEVRMIGKHGVLSVSSLVES